MKNAIRCALCLLMGATSLAAYAGEGYESTTAGNAGDAAEAQPGDATSATPTATDEGHASGEPMRSTVDTSVDTRASELAAIDQLNRERVNRENWAPVP